MPPLFVPGLGACAKVLSDCGQRKGRYGKKRGASRVASPFYELG